MTRLAWFTDPHFNFLHSGDVERFGSSLSSADRCLITGDISEGPSIVRHLTEFQRGFGKTVYFVLGNHDFYGSSFAKVASLMRDLTSRNKNLIWLNSVGVQVVGKAQLCGVDGWYDAQLGRFYPPAITMSDWTAIQELKIAYLNGPLGLIHECRAQGIQSAFLAGEKLVNVDPSKKLLFATHVAPYAESAWHEGKVSGPDFVPWFTNHVLGQELSRFAEANPVCDMTTMCGHSHSTGTFQQSKNHTVLTAAAKYGYLSPVEYFDL